MSATESLTQERLKKLLHYNPLTGIFTRKVSTSNRANIGDVAGGKMNKGYIHIRVDGKKYLAHRLAALYMNGSFPDKQMDHLDHVRHNNAWDNLRSATQEENQHNASMRHDNTSGFTGVIKNKKLNKWASSITVNGKNNHLGVFYTHLAACYARHYANMKHNFHPNHGINGDKS